jgi:hypothetical protein
MYPIQSQMPASTNQMTFSSVFMMPPILPPRREERERRRMPWHPLDDGRRGRMIAR